MPLKKDHRLFLSAWLRAPHHIASIAPSSRALAHAMATQLPPGDGLIVELGGGTGAITKALLAEGISPERLLVVERDKILHQHLQEEFPELKIILGDAANLKSELKMDCPASPIHAVVSGLPMVSIDYSIQKKILEQAFECMGDDGLFIQFTYSPFPPISHTLINELGLDSFKVSRVWKNIPPAVVWRYSPKKSLHTIS